MVERALTYPLEGSGKFRHVIGTTLLVFSWAIFPLFLLVGYYIQTLTYASTGREDPPTFGNLFSLSKLGAIGTVIAFTYAGFFIAAPLVSVAFVASLVMTPGGTSDLEFLLYAFGGVALLFAFIMALILPVVLGQYGRTGDFSTAYDIDGLVTLLKTRQVQKAILGTFLLTGILTITVTLFSIVTLGFGIFLIPVIFFWYMIVTAYLYGTGIGEATGTITTVRYQDVVEEINSHDQTDG